MDNRAIFPGVILVIDTDISFSNTFKKEFKKVVSDVKVAHTVTDAIRKIKNNKVELIVLDYDFKDTNNNRIIKKLRISYPQINLILSSNYENLEEASEAVNKGLALDYFNKTHTMDLYEDKIIHSLHEMKNKKIRKLEDKIYKVDKLPISTVTFKNLMKAISLKEPFEKISNIIASDISLTAIVIHEANSFSYETDTVHTIYDAVLMLTLERIKDIVQNRCLISQHKWTGQIRKYFYAIMAHSQIVAIYHPIFYNLLYKRELSKQQYLIGILHDLGKIVMLQYFPEEFKAVMNHKKKNPLYDFFQAEKDLGMTGNTHADLGGFLMREWHFPAQFIECAFHHHEPAKVMVNYRYICEALKIADDLANYMWQFRHSDTFNLDGFYNISNFPSKVLEKIASRMHTDLKKFV